MIKQISTINTMFKVLFNRKDKILALQGRIVIPTIITMLKALLTYVNIIDSLDMQSYAMSQAGMGFLQAPSGRIRNSSPSAFGLGRGIPNPALGRLQKSPIVASGNLSSKPPSHKTSRERALFIMLCCITFTFFICHLPR